MSTSCGWCRRAGYDDCFCGAERPQRSFDAEIIEEQAQTISELRAENQRRSEVLRRLWDLISQDPKLYKKAREATVGIFPQGR